MSFVIDEARVGELLKSTMPGYEVSITDIGPTVENYTPYYSAMAGVSGTITVDRERAISEGREQLASIREKIERSGSPLHSTAELVREIDEMRGESH